MQFAINTPTFGSFGEARILAELACEAEDTGWDGFFVWDHIGGSPEQAQPMADPWIALAAMVMVTQPHQTWSYGHSSATAPTLETG